MGSQKGNVLYSYVRGASLPVNCCGGNKINTADLWTQCISIGIIHYLNFKKKKQFSILFSISFENITTGNLRVVVP